MSQENLPLQPAGPEGVPPDQIVGVPEEAENPFTLEKLYEKLPTLRALDEGAEFPDLSSLITSDELVMLSKASGGFSFRPDRKLARKSLVNGVLDVGYTYTDKTGKKKQRTIFYNPLMLVGIPELDVEAWSRTDAIGFAIHESGHHAPEVREVDKGYEETFKRPELIPEPFRGDPKKEARFFRAMHRHLHNVLADIWLERFMGRRPYRFSEKSIVDRRVKDGFIEDMSQMKVPEHMKKSGREFTEEELHVPKPIQLMNTILQETYFPDQRTKTDSDVAESLARVRKSGAFAALLDRSAYENYFASDGEKTRLLQRKIEAYQKVFLPEYLKMVMAEYEYKKQQKKKEKGGEGEPGQGSSSSGKPSKDTMPGNPSGSGGGAEDWDFSNEDEESSPDPDDDFDQGDNDSGEDEDGEVQGDRINGQDKKNGKGKGELSDEEKEQIVEEILNALDEAGHDSETESDEEKEAREGKIRDEINKFRERQKNKKGQEPDDKKKKSGHDALKDLANELAQKDKASSERGLSGKHGVREESVRHWKEIKSKYQPEITAMASDFAEVFLDDRRKRLEYLKREGEIIPGLEYETIAALLSGELDPDTRMKSVQNPDFLETEVEFIIDTSGSMGGEKIKSSVELMVMTVEAFKQVRELLSDEDLLIEGEEPLRVGVTAFSTLPERITPLTEPLSDQKELKIVDKSSEVGGGTDEADTIRQTYEQLAVGRDNVLKIITVLSDGYGNREGVAPIMQQVEKDDRVIFLAVGFGNTDEEASAVTATYLDPISDHGKNIHAITVTDPKESVSKVVEFLRREVTRHRL